MACLLVHCATWIQSSHHVSEKFPTENAPNIPPVKLDKVEPAFKARRQTSAVATSVDQWYNIEERGHDNEPARQE